MFRELILGVRGPHVGAILGGLGLHVGAILGVWAGSGSQARLGRHLGWLQGGFRPQHGPNLVGIKIEFKNLGKNIWNFWIFALSKNICFRQKFWFRGASLVHKFAGQIYNAKILEMVARARFYQGGVPPFPQPPLLSPRAASASQDFKSPPGASWSLRFSWTLPGSSWPFSGPPKP